VSPTNSNKIVNNKKMKIQKDEIINHNNQKEGKKETENVTKRRGDGWKGMGITGLEKAFNG